LTRSCSSTRDRKVRLFSCVFFGALTDPAGFRSDTTIVTVFTWLALGLLFVSLTMVVNGYLIRRELLVYFLALYIRLFALAFQLIAVGIGVTHMSTLSAVFTFVLIGLVIVVELIAYGFLLVQLDDLSAAEAEEIPTDIEGAGVLTKQLTSVNSWTTAVFQFLLVFVPGYGPMLAMGHGKKGK
jgi:hypothetical protein